MDRPEYELVTNAKEKYENQDIFSMISPYFLRLQHHRIIYNKCRGAWRRRAVRSLSVVESGAIGFACTIFLFREEHGAWTRGAALAQIGWRRIPTATASKREKVWWLFWSEGLAVKVWWFVLCRVWPMLVVGCYFLSCPVKPAWNDVWNKWLINGTSVLHFLQPSARNPQFLEYSCIF